VPKFKEKRTGMTIYVPWEVTQFLNHSRPEMVPFLAIGAFAGLRSAEIGRLDWSEVHLADKFIEIKAAKAKTASRRIVPISGNLAKWLKPHAKDEGRVVPFELPETFRNFDWQTEAARGDTKKGQELFTTRGCAVCRGIKSGDKGGGGPSLAGAGTHNHPTLQNQARFLTRLLI